jgi:hydroxylysine kinase
MTVSKFNEAVVATETAQNKDGLDATHIRMTDVEALRWLEDLFSIKATAKRLDTEKDDSFCVDASDGRRFILKVANPNENMEIISFQVDLMRHVGVVDRGLPVPVTLHGLNGQDIQHIVDAAGQSRHLRLMSYLDGTPLDSTGSTDTERGKVGEMLARLRLATGSFGHPADNRVLAWDIQHLPSLYPLLAEVANAEHKKLLAAGIERFELFRSVLPRLRRQVLHNDFSKSNIIVNHAAAEFVTGIIDFGDAVRTAIAIDVSTALLNQLPRDAASRKIDDLLAEGRDVLQGYLRIADLTEEELGLIPHLIMGRIIARALITLWRARLIPENSVYILRNTEQGWGQLKWFLERPFSSISAMLIS